MLDLSLPLGLRDLTPDHSAHLAELSARLHEVFAGFRYRRLLLPTLERLDVVERGLSAVGARPGAEVRRARARARWWPSGPTSPRRSSGSTRRGPDALPTPARLCYDGPVLRAREARAGRPREVYQAGVELLGAGGPAADAEALVVLSQGARPRRARRRRARGGARPLRRHACSEAAGLRGAARAEAEEALSRKDEGVLSRLAGRARGVAGGPQGPARPWPPSTGKGRCRGPGPSPRSVPGCGRAARRGGGGPPAGATARAARGGGGPRRGAWPRLLHRASPSPGTRRGRAARWPPAAATTGCWPGSGAPGRPSASRSTWSSPPRRWSEGPRAGPVDDGGPRSPPLVTSDIARAEETAHRCEEPGTCRTSSSSAPSGATRARARSSICFTEFADVVVRFQGGNNAGHTLVVGGEKTVLHLIPAGVLHQGKVCVIGNGVVVDPTVFMMEIDRLKQKGYLADDSQLVLSLDAHVIMPWHKAVDIARESADGAGKIGTTGRGIGPTYEDKVARRGIRVRDLLDAAKLGRRVKERLPVAQEELRRLGAGGDARRRRHHRRSTRRSASGSPSTRRTPRACSTASSRAAARSSSRAPRAPCSTSTTAPTRSSPARTPSRPTPPPAPASARPPSTR